MSTEAQAIRDLATRFFDAIEAGEASDARLWRGAAALPLLTSFQPEALQGAVPDPAGVALYSELSLLQARLYDRLADINAAQYEFGLRHPLG